MSKLTLKMLRAKHNLKQEDAAKMVGVSKDTWGNWERGKTTPKMETAYHIAETFHVELDDIIFLPDIAV
ncbi:helix-turn-helix transcriptional regulator [Streptococcus agalactiae]|uniref:helix-turn-helix transcriptional regulator n=1 Tax=Streptococcus agalactiae TaxID=1311 RepID=UPI00085BE6CA|nr:helix-turn-helix transcriptional regulator [Streptococcus agalactiae]